jgi:hypothetical protein
MPKSSDHRLAGSDEAAVTRHLGREHLKGLAPVPMARQKTPIFSTAEPAISPMRGTDQRTENRGMSTGSF